MRFIAGCVVPHGLGSPQASRPVRDAESVENVALRLLRGKPPATQSSVWLFVGEVECVFVAAGETWKSELQRLPKVMFACLGVGAHGGGGKRFEEVGSGLS
jgi:hypothetical protein